MFFRWSFNFFRERENAVWVLVIKLLVVGFGELLNSHLSESLGRNNNNKETWETFLNGHIFLL